MQYNYNVLHTYIVLLHSVIVNKKMKGRERMKALTDFGIEIKTALLKQNKTHKWLQEQVTEKTGSYFDSSYLHKIMTGEANPEHIKAVIREVLGMKKGA